MLRRAMLRFARDRKANVAIIFALMMVPTIFLLGMALDYTLALRKREQLNAAADAAAIAAVRPAMLTQTDSAVVKATAQAVFAAKANLPGLSSVPTPTVTVTDSGLARTITVSYTAQSVNNFPGVLGRQTWQIGGSSTAKASSAPNMNFYLLLDDSPSMAIAATQTDINNMITATKNQPSGSKNCAFACHETNPQKDSGASSSTKDNLYIARANNITLRIDLVQNAVTQLMVGPWTCPQSGVSGGVMQCMAALNNTTYNAAIYTFDYGLNTIQTLTTPTSAGTKISNIQLMTVDHQNCIITNSSGNCVYSTDYGTDISGGLTGVNAVMPAPGTGTNQSGDTPQEVVFLVTDGVEDKLMPKPGTCDANATYPLPTGSSTTVRCQQPLDTTICTTIKNRGIRIAVLYTEYLQLTTDSWYNSRIAQFNNPSSSSGTIAQRLQSCASPGLYASVQTGGDISAALTNLFIKVASSTASLVQ
ncbi:TadE/TadG family type IV pilus assembly protein [Bradyrhizobium liaoningense]|uniref:TadE/TadG family type IV pilus assembly protein n=1 Tax=Bradyrhizobium liaoningense TaxID=43992 RepID=UPI001BA6E8B6|nr:TadE/TadG family type IV pilus assembly protein [Bradyrhizobium liaoningense]MBR0706169.1 pilus assembly protein [Bradyrhizobium liaoningense]